MDHWIYNGLPYDSEDLREMMIIMLRLDITS